MIPTFKLDTDIKEDIYDLFTRMTEMMAYYSVLSEQKNESVKEELLNVYRLQFNRYEKDIYVLNNYLIIKDYRDYSTHILEVDINDPSIYLFNLSNRDMPMARALDNFNADFIRFWGDLDHTTIDNYTVPDDINIVDYLYDALSFLFNATLDKDQFIEDIKWVQIT